MAKVTYIPRHDGDPIKTETLGQKFKANEPVEVDGRTKAGKLLLETLANNPWFSIDGKGAVPVGITDPKTAEEYRAYALEWINVETSAVAFSKRWDSEAALREKVGWGTEDEDLIQPIIGPRLELLKRAEG
jgi:hypothetical protein